MGATALLVVVAGGFIVAAPEGPAVGDLARTQVVHPIQGEWGEMTVLDGSCLARAPRGQISITDGRVRCRSDFTNFDSRYTISGNGRSGNIDFRDGNDDFIRGIYLVEGNSLALC